MIPRGTPSNLKCLVFAAIAFACAGPTLPGSLASAEDLAPGDRRGNNHELRKRLGDVAVSRADVGSRLPVPPPQSPIASVLTGRDPLEVAVEMVQIGDPGGALRLLEAWQSGSLQGAERSAARARLAPARFLAGWLGLVLDQPTVAVDNFSRIRTGAGPLASRATWYEALAEMRRGRPASAARLCVGYRQKWPDEHHAEDCLLLAGQAWLEAGAWGAAQKAFQDFIELDPESPNVEVARLGASLAVAGSSPARGVPSLQRLALNYLYPTTGRTAREALCGIVGPSCDPDYLEDPDALMQAALSARRAREKTEAWTLYQRVATLASSTPQASAWMEREAEGFERRTGHFREQAVRLEAKLRASPDAGTLQALHETLSRGGYWAEAADLMDQGRAEFGDNLKWQPSLEKQARVHMFAGNWARAADLWDDQAKRGVNPRDARWYAAWCLYKAGRLPEARTRLDRVIAEGGPRALGARYFKARLAESEGRKDEAEIEYELILQERPWSWYATLIRERRADEEVAAASSPTTGRTVDGRFAIPERPELPEAPATPVAHPGAFRGVGPFRGELEAPPVRTGPFARLRWKVGADAFAKTPVSPATLPEAPWPSEFPPPGYPKGPYFDPKQARMTFDTAVKKYKAVWPELEAALLLADAGVYHLSGEIVARCIAEYEETRGTPRAALLSTVTLDARDWRQIALFARDHHHTSRLLWGLHKNVEDEEARRRTLALAWPLAFPEALWPAARAFRVDPYVLLALMRQESTYRSWAVSSAGAIGLMQVMPTTGALVAKGLGEARYVPRDLEDPSRNILYGAWYFDRLLVRFGGSLPLAVASYNAGPQTVHPWIASSLGNLEIEDFVEMIPVEETRNYVLRVLENYATYTHVYAPSGTRVRIDLRPNANDPNVIDF